MGSSITANGVGLITLPDLAAAPEIAPPDCCEADKASESAPRVRGPFIGRDLADDDYQQIAEILYEQQNFNLTGYKALCIKRRLAMRIRTAGHNDPEAYIELLRESEDEQQQLLITLSIHVSEFFRNPSVYKVLAEKVLPDLFTKTAQSGSKMRIWSVGCAHGEEPYSVALLCSSFRQRHKNVAIVATDLSSAALNRAKQGLFPVERTRGVPPELLAQYFTQAGEGYQLAEDICDQVQFFRHDILIDPPFYRADLILCRNLLIYFSREQQQKILELLAMALLPGGYLVLGRAETLASACRSHFVCVNPAERIYQRVAE